MTAIKSRSHCVLHTCIITILVLLLCGCSGSGKHTYPVTPADPGSNQNIGLSDGIPNSGNRYTLGVWDFHVDPATQTVTGSQRRNADMHLNIVRLLEKACADCLRFDNFDFSTPGQLDVDMTIKHPFEGNLALTIFDVRGIFMTDGNSEAGLQFAWGNDLPVCINADGYTGLFCEYWYPFNPDEPAVFNYYPGVLSWGENRSGQLNAYVAYGKENPRRMFLPGTEESRTLQIALPGIPFDFGYAVNVCWALPDADPVVDPVDDFPITANCPEAYKLNITIGDGLTTDPGSKAIIEVEVFDHQGHETIRYNDFDGVSIPSFSSRLNRLDGWLIWWSSPVSDTPHFEFYKETGEDSFLFTAIIEQELQLSIEEGIYPLEIYVSDTDEDPNLGSRGATHVIPVFLQGGVDALPVAEALAYPVPQTVGKPVQFRNNGSYDPDGGAITKFEWDWDMDGTFDDEGYFAFHWFSTPGTHSVNLRVTDNEGSSRTLFEPLEVMIKEGEGWARTWGSQYSDSAWNVAVDDAGNIYVAGYYGSTIDFDPSPFLETMRHSAAGFISKFGRDGQFKWVRTLIGSSSSAPASLIIGDNGKLYAVGNFWYPLTFEGDPTQTKYFAGSGADIFLCSYSTAGIFQWTKTWGGDEGGIGASQISLDGTGNIYIGGSFDGTIDFDPGPGTEFHTAHFEQDCYIEKLSPTGDFIWVGTWGSEPYEQHIFENKVRGIAIDSNDSVYCTGYFEGMVDFDPGPETDFHSATGFPPDYDLDVFLSKFTSDGEYQWVRTWGGTQWEEGHGVAIDSNDNISAIGFFHETVDFDPGPGEFELTAASAYGAYGPYMSRFNTDGDFIWALTWNAAPYWYDRWLSIGLDAWDNIFLTGIFKSTADFDPGPGIEERTANGGYNCYLSKFNADGEFLWVGTWGGLDSNIDAFGVAADSLGYASVVGRFYGTADFDPGPGEDLHSVYEYTIGGAGDTFLTRFPPDGNW